MKRQTKAPRWRGSVFGEIERMISATQAGFDVAQKCVDPIELRQIIGIATVRVDWPVLAARIRNPGHTAQSIGSDYMLSFT